MSAAGLDPNDSNCTDDVYHFDFPANNQILTSLDSQNRVPNYAFGSPAPCPLVDRRAEPRTRWPRTTTTT